MPCRPVSLLVAFALVLGLVSVACGQQPAGRSNPWALMRLAAFDERVESAAERGFALLEITDQGHDGHHHHGDDHHVHDHHLQDHDTHQHDHHQHHGHHHGPDSYAPAGLMDHHLHEKGGWMVEYKFMQMYMDGNRVGDTRVSDVQALDASGVSFAVTPTRMNMDMHMLHFMVGLTDKLTLHVMPMALSLTMDHLRRDTTTFRTHNEGFGDLAFGVIWQLYQGCTDELVLNLAASAPTGSIDELTSGGMLFPYPMRLGSGTVDFRPGATYKSHEDWGTLGVQFQTDLPVGTNSAGYSEGDQYWLNLWVSYLVGPCEKAALTFRVENYWRQNINGFDRRIGAMPTNVSTNRPDMRGGYWLNFGYGMIYELPGGSIVNFEMTHPVYQHVDGVQLETDWTLAASWSKIF